MLCSVCSTESNQRFEKRILKKYDVKYFLCPNCGYMETEVPYWLDEAYSESISFNDTGLVERNSLVTKVLSFIILFFFNSRGKFLDFGGGTGLFTRMMRDQGFDFYWNDKYTPNVHSRGFELDNPENLEGITSIEVVEHMPGPLSYFEEITEKYNPNFIFFTTEVFSEDSLNQDWWYFQPENGQHISFFQIKTLDRIANSYGYKLYTYKNFHIFSKNRINSLVFKVLIRVALLLQKSLSKWILKSRVESDYELILENQK